MKKKYYRPSAAFINYEYDEQVVAESANYNGRGDPAHTGYCQWWSGAYIGGCNDNLLEIPSCKSIPDMTSLFSLP